ncbi:MAG TPA: hypothetical protein VEL76_38015 [Gemmataceae bacterium]|nr:hypothetical protein [Gemmataceae bacterium]
MFSDPSRRAFLSSAAGAGVLASLGDFAFLRGLPPLSAAQVQAVPNVVRLAADIEPLVRMLEDTPRERLLEEAGQRIRTGTSYQEMLAAVLLAGVRSIRPRPVGFQFHAVLVTNSAHLASVAAQDRDRWLPLFWALDNFKTSQARHLQSTDWKMPPVNEARLPEAAHARRRFIEAMDNWDEEGADVAIASLVRSAGASEVIELFWRYGARDFRDIGHKAIYSANAWRTLNTIGWRHAEPVMRSLAFALLEHSGTNPARRDDPADRPWRENLARAARIRRDWRRGRITPQATTDLLAALRTAAPSEGSERIVTMLNNGIDPSSLWDGLLLTAGELIGRQPGIVGIHCVTTVNALHFAYQTSENDETRQMLLLQGAAFLPMFRQAMLGRGRLSNLRIDTLERQEPQGRGPQAIEEIFADVSRDRTIAARKTLGLLQRDQASAQALMAAGRRLIFTKGRDSHDYKFSSAALEDFYHATPAWRDRFLATSMFNLRGSGQADNDLIRRTRTALGNA